jgi:hypothetical protein
LSPAFGFCKRRPTHCGGIEHLVGDTWQNNRFTY